MHNFCPGKRKSALKAYTTERTSVVGNQLSVSFGQGKEVMVRSMGGCHAAQVEAGESEAQLKTNFVAWLGLSIQAQTNRSAVTEIPHSCT